MATIATLAINLIGNVSGLKSALTDAQQSIKATASSMTSMGSKMTGAVSLPILGVAGAALKGAAEMEQLEVSFTTMLKSGDRAKALMADLTAFSAETPFELPEVMTAGKMLLAYGVAAEDVQGTLRQLGDVAAGVGAPIGDIAYLFGTARVSGRLFAADVNQFTNRGIPIISALAKTMGVAEGSIKKMVEEGKVGFPQLQAALSYLTENGGQFEGLMEAQSQTLAGMFSTLKDNIGITLATIGRSIVDAFDLRTKLAGALEMMGRVKEFIVNLAQTNPGLLKLGVIVAAVAAAIGPLLVGLGMVAGALANLMPVIAVLGGALGALLSPLGLVAAGIAAAFYFDVGGIRGRVAELFGLFEPLLDYFRGLDWSSVGAAFASIQTIINDAFANLRWDGILSVLGNIRTAVVDYITGLDWSVVTGAFDTLRTAITGAFNNFDWGAVLTTLGTIRTAVVDYITSLDWSVVTGALGALSTAIGDALANLNLRAAMSGLQTAFSNAVSGLDLGGIFTGLQDTLTTVRDTIAGVVDAIIAIWGRLLDFFGPSITRLQESFGTMISGFGELGPTFAALQEAIMSAANAIAPVVQFLGAVIGGVLGVGAIVVLNALAATFEALPGIVAAAIAGVTAVINLIADVVGGMVQIVTSLIQGDFAGAWDGLKTIVGGVLDFIQASLSNWATVLGTAFGAVRTIIVGTFSDLASALGLDGALAAVTTFKDNLVAVFSGDIFGAAMPAWLSTLVGWVWPMLPEAPGWLTTLISWTWPLLFGPPGWITALVAWTWPGFIGQPGWLSGLLSWKWPGFPGAPGWLSSLLSFRWPSFPSAPAWLTNLNPFGGSDTGNNALGTQYWRGGLTWVGESRPELVNLPRGARVFSGAESAAMAGAGGPTVVIQQAIIRDERDIHDLAYRIEDLRRRRR